jgi:hypothetical protein
MFPPRFGAYRCELLETVATALRVALMKKVATRVPILQKIVGMEEASAVMRITKHDKSYIVELSDGSAWRVWPADMAETLQWLPTTEIDVIEIDDETCSHALINRSDGSQVRVIKANREWSVDEVQQPLSD